MTKTTEQRIVSVVEKSTTILDWMLHTFPGHTLAWQGKSVPIAALYAECVVLGAELGIKPEEKCPGCDQPVHERCPTCAKPVHDFFDHIDIDCQHD